MMVDIRHTPTNDDKTMYKWIKSRNLPYFIIANKVDKIPYSQINKRLQDIKSTLNVEDKKAVIPFSSETKQGRNEIWDLIIESVQVVEE